VEEINLANTSTQPSGTCQNCQQRPATTFWTGTEGTLAFVHGMYQQWCMVCCLKEQLRYAREQAARIPEIEAHLAQLETKEEEVSGRTTEDTGDEGSDRVVLTVYSKDDG